MKPAASIVVFTTLSGAGYGLLFWLAVLRPAGLVPQSAWFGVPVLLLALALVTAGLLSSLLHLGRPERAWRALSQWRSSWLSREGVAAVATFPPAILFGLAMLAGRDGLALVFGLLAAAGAAATVWCTGMIYASLKPVREWHLPLVAPGYLVFGAFTGAALLVPPSALAGRGAGVALLAAVLAAVALAVKRAFWAAADAAPAPAGLASLTGLGRFGTVRPLDPPNAGTAYLMREMGFRIARAHAARLRRIVVLGGFLAPALLLAAAAAVPGAWAALPALPAAAAALGGMLVERWLFFAEATHTVAAYYRG
ncbi:MAG: dimethyl sulfoxide reductase anchor subunit [Acetobacteraceae bacterium]|nr:dimethyl sulfoxide reductase anchor subunit [Acetobacteraceae bacterium]MDW8397648.1 DmsC/YnfH family molybdoenzyme membrane anchor subunit [Acetobacteraceae bacterium]